MAVKVGFGHEDPSPASLGTTGTWSLRTLPGGYTALASLGCEASLLEPGTRYEHSRSPMIQLRHSGRVSSHLMCLFLQPLQPFLDFR